MIDLNRYFDKPFKEGAKGPDAFDCAGLLADIYRQRGIILPDWNRPDSADGKREEIERGASAWVCIDKPVPWCGVAISMHGKFVTHVGVVLDDCTRFIHTTEKTGVCVDRLKSPLWENRIRGFYVWPHQT